LWILFGYFQIFAFSGFVFFWQIFRFSRFRVHPAATRLFEFSRFRVFGWTLRPSPKHDDTEIQNTVYIIYIYITPVCCRGGGTPRKKK
jgi:hypothetical protein